MLLGKISVIIVVHMLAVALMLNWFRFKSSFRLLVGLYLYFFLTYYTAAKILSAYPKLWNPIEAGLIDRANINSSYK